MNNVSQFWIQVKIPFKSAYGSRERLKGVNGTDSSQPFSKEQAEVSDVSADIEDYIARLHKAAKYPAVPAIKTYVVDLTRKLVR
jgi:hypothetical protein